MTAGTGPRRGQSTNASRVTCRHTAREEGREGARQVRHPLSGQGDSTHPYLHRQQGRKQGPLCFGGWRREEETESTGRAQGLSGGVIPERRTLSQITARSLATGLSPFLKDGFSSGSKVLAGGRLLKCPCYESVGNTSHSCAVLSSSGFVKSPQDLGCPGVPST